jgi:hypothetical protein
VEFGSGSSGLVESLAAGGGDLRRVRIGAIRRSMMYADSKVDGFVLLWSSNAGVNDELCGRVVVLERRVSAVSAGEVNKSVVSYAIATRRN